MKHFIKVFCFIILCLPLKGFTEVDSSKINNSLQNAFVSTPITITKADQILNEEYSFYSDTSGKRFLHLLKKADLLLSEGKPKDAESTLQRIPLYNIPETDLGHFYKTSTLCAYINGENENAISTLKQYELFDSIQLSKDTTAQLLKCLVLLAKDDYKELGLCFSNFKNQFSISNAQSVLIDSLIDVGKNLKLKSLKKATLLSAIIPGTGQMYSGHFEEGLVNFGLNLTTLSFTVYCIYKGYYATGILVGYTLFQRFYTGGLRRADKLVKDYNDSKTIPLKQNLKERLIKLNLHNK